MVAIADPWLLQGVYVAILEQPQVENAPEFPEISHKRHAWKTLKK
jgi:hypothetical protein